MPEAFTVWLTPGLQTGKDGLRRVTATEYKDRGSIQVIEGNETSYFYVEGVNWHRSRESALKRATDLRDESLDFENLLSPETSDE